MKVRLHFREMMQDSQEYGSNDEHMVSRVLLDVEAEGRVFRGVYVDVKQTVGSSFENGPLEVSPPKDFLDLPPPKDFKGPWDAKKCGEAVEAYYRSLVGKMGRSIRIEGGARNIRMKNNRHSIQQTVELDIDAPARGGW